MMSYNLNCFLRVFLVTNKGSVREAKNGLVNLLNNRTYVTQLKVKL